jgi:hypothetical protein
MEVYDPEIALSIWGVGSDELPSPTLAWRAKIQGYFAQEVLDLFVTVRYELVPY